MVDEENQADLTQATTTEHIAFLPKKEKVKALKRPGALASPGKAAIEKGYL